MTPWFVKLSRGYRRRQLFRGQQVVGVDADGLEHVREAVRQGHGVLITPNHSTHYDSAALYLALDTIRQPVYFMTAWQVFAMSTGWERWAMQHLGCFSIDRESSDRQSFKQAVEILKQSPQPLVIFPEGDIYHVNDRVFPFREGAAAIALSAARKGERPVSMIPCAIKFWY
ncbi:MAG: 1-acyl-sn-glycerol-3-phosphate acyltransferase, partial [Planctomycetales bacterium]|nr:1-acyl-sn-glycerol-3-phosphate acyltransferase [Planctomycetales bacterium]